MNYSLTKTDIAKEKEKGVLLTAWRRLVPLLAEENRAVTIAITAILVSSAAALVVPIIIAHVVDVYLVTKNFHGVVMYSEILAAIFLVGLVSSYLQVKTMGGVGRRLLFNLRNKIFNKLQELPVAFFNQNKAGDLISRINNDTDKLNQFFAQALMQFLSNIILIFGTGIFLLVIDYKLGIIALIPAVVALISVANSSIGSVTSVNFLSQLTETIINFPSLYC